MKQRSLYNDGWLSEFKKGNDVAFRNIFNTYYKSLCYFAGKLLTDKEEAEDMVAEAFGKLWQQHASFETEQHIKSFLYTATRNACLNLLKHKQRATLSQKEILYLGKDLDDDNSLTDMIEAELLDKLYQGIENLPTKCRNVAKLIFQEGLSTKEAAKRLNMTERNVLNQKTRAIQLLRTRFLLLLVYLYIVKSLL